MTISRPLVASIVGTLVLLEYSTDDQVEPRVAAQGMEDIVSSLATLTHEEQQEFLTICIDIAQDYQGAARTEIPLLIAESLGLGMP